VPTIWRTSLPGSGQVNKPAIVVHGSDSAVRISRLHGPHFKSDTLKIVDDPRNRNPIFGVVLDLNVDKIHARFQFEVGKGVAVYELLGRHHLAYLAFHLAAVF